METGRWIRRFAGRARRWRRVRSLAVLLLRHGLWWALFLLLLHYVAPGWTWIAVAVAAVVLGVQLAGAWWRMRGESWRQVLQPVGTPRAGVLADQLATWVWWDRRGQPASGMARWLEGDLATELGALPVENVRRIGRRPLGRVRYLIPWIVLLLLLQLLQLPLPGLGGGDPPPSLSLGTGPGGGAALPLPLPMPRTAELPAPPQQDPQDTEPPDPAPPRPLLEDLAPEEQFVVPQFVGDGPTRREMARQARIEEYGTSAPPPRAAGGAGDPRQPDPPDFQAAYERALRARHVPEEERGIVKRYFDLLRGEGR